MVMTNNESLVTVSVIIPAYNAEKFIKESIDSVLSQTFNNFEIIVIDDGSSDNTFNIANSYGANVKVYMQNNAGAGAARNYGAKLAKGAWLAFLDADDLWAPEKLELQMSISNNYFWSYTDSYFIGSSHNGSLKSSDVSPHMSGKVVPTLIVNNFIGTSTVMIRKDIFLSVGGFDQSLRALQDWDLWLKIAAKYELGYISAPQVKYRVHSNSTSRSTRKTRKYHLEIIRRTFSPGGVGENYKDLKRLALAESYGVLALISEDTSDFSFSWFCALKSALYQPTKLYRWKSIARISFNWLRSFVNR